MDLNHVKCIIFDLDDTLYPQNNGIWEMIGVRINQFLLEEMHFSPNEVSAIRHKFWSEYGTTLRGLQIEYSVDMDAYLDYVHNIPLEYILNPDPVLDQLLEALPHRKVIFTNANAAHAHRVIDLLEIGRHFDTVVDIYLTSPYCKPEKAAFQMALNHINEMPQGCLLVDDSPKNLVTAERMGINVVSVGKNRYDGCPYIETIHDLPSLFSI